MHKQKSNNKKHLNQSTESTSGLTIHSDLTTQNSNNNKNNTNKILAFKLMQVRYLETDEGLYQVLLIKNQMRSVPSITHQELNEGLCQVLLQT